MDWIEALVLGIVQGVTEFLPVSSDGHLVLTQKLFERWRGVSHGGAENLFFDVMLHVGTVAAIVLHHRAVVRTGAKGLLGSQDVPPAYRRPAVVRVGILAFVATLPLVPYALAFKDLLDRAFTSLRITGGGFLVTAAVLFLTARLGRAEQGRGPSETTWRDALLIGLAQMLAPLPGVSRSGLTVATALGLGLSRSWAVGFSLLIAVPAIMGATVFELKKFDPQALTSGRVAQIVAAAAVAGVVGYMAIIWLVKVVRAGRLWYFSVYLTALGIAVLMLAPADVPAPGGSTHARHAEALDRPHRGLAPRAGAGVVEARGLEPLDRADAVGARPGPARPGAAAYAGLRSPRLLLGRRVAIRP